MVTPKDRKDSAPTKQIMVGDQLVDADSAMARLLLEGVRPVAGWVEREQTREEISQDIKELIDRAG